jgi:hypothetical protein
MLAKSVGFRCFVHCVTVSTLGLLICLTNSVQVQAQKTPPIFKSDTNTSAVNLTYVRQLEGEYTANAQAKNEIAKLARNRLIAIGVEQVDTAFNDYRKKSRKRHDLLQFIFDFLEIGASTAISITGGERSKALIGEGLSLFQGSRAAFNRDFKFLERQILFDKMVAKRSQTLTEIYKKLDQDVGLYPWEQARSELKDYFYAGTIDEALNSLSVDTGAEAKTSQKELAEAKKRAGIKGAPTPEQIAEAKVNFELIRSINGKGFAIQEQIEAENKKAAPNTTTLKTLEESKKKVLDDLKSIFALIEADPQLSPLLGQIPERFGKDNPAVKTKLEVSLKKLKDTPNDASLDDYDLILTKLNGVVVDTLPEDPTLGGRLRTILTPFNKP